MFSILINEFVGAFFKYIEPTACVLLNLTSYTTKKALDRPTS